MHAFYAAVGHASRAWQLFEHELYSVFAKLVQADDPMVTSAIFHTAVNFSIKLAMTDAAAQFALEKKPDLSMEWSTLKDRISKRSKRRNEITHFAHTIHVDRRTGNSEMVLVRDFTNTNNDKHWLKGDSGMMRVKDILEAKDSFLILARDTEFFGDKLSPIQQRQ